MYIKSLDREILRVLIKQQTTCIYFVKKNELMNDKRCATYHY